MSAAEPLAWEAWKLCTPPSWLPFTFEGGTRSSGNKRNPTLLVSHALIIMVAGETHCGECEAWTAVGMPVLPCAATRRLGGARRRGAEEAHSGEEELLWPRQTNCRLRPTMGNAS